MNLLVLPFSASWKGVVIPVNLVVSTVPTSSEGRLQSFLKTTTTCQSLKCQVCVLTTTAGDLQTLLEKGSFSSVDLVEMYLEQIGKYNAKA